MKLCIFYRLCASQCFPQLLSWKSFMILLASPSTPITQPVPVSMILSLCCLSKEFPFFPVQKKGYTDLQDSFQETMLCYGSTLQNDPTRSLPCSWTSGDPSSYLVRGESYLRDNHKVSSFCSLKIISLPCRSTMRFRGPQEFSILRWGTFQLISRYLVLWNALTYKMVPKNIWEHALTLLFIYEPGLTHANRQNYWDLKTDP